MINQAERQPLSEAAYISIFPPTFDFLTDLYDFNGGFNGVCGTHVKVLTVDKGKKKNIIIFLLV